METATKICNKCNIEKSLSEFYKNNSKKSGIASQCKKCDNNRRKRNYINTYKILSSEEKEKINKKRRERYLIIKHCENYKAKIKENYTNNREKSIQRAKKYNKTINGKIVKRCAERKRKDIEKKSNDKTINKKSLIELREIQKNKCYYCDCELDFLTKGKVHLDHYIPISKGGFHSISNVVWSCDKCNLSKGAKMPTTLMIV